jgi:hypothetical protein
MTTRVGTSFFGFSQFFFSEKLFLKRKKKCLLLIKIWFIENNTQLEGNSPVLNFFERNSYKSSVIGLKQKIREI